MFLLNQTTHRMLIQYDPDVGHRFVPNLKARLPGEGGFFVVTNSLGFRSDFEYEPGKNGRSRILMYGDSYTAGDNVGNSERYSDVLSRLIGAEVQNYGVSGSGTDQHLLIHRKFGRGMEADLVMICVQIDSFHRIRMSHRPAIDRITGRHVLVPKPYFELKNGRLEERHVPVPLERPIDRSAGKTGKLEDGLLEQVRDWYLKVPGLKEIRHSDLFDTLGSRVISEMKRLRNAHPYPDIESADTPGWKLMEAILRQFISDARPLPVVIVPIPTKEFYQEGMEPVYQPLFNAMDDPPGGIHVCDVSTRLVNLPWETRQKLGFEVGGHFTPLANRMVGEMMADFLKARKLISPASVAASPAAAPEPSAFMPVRKASSTYVLGVSAFYHNSAASLIRDGEIVAAAEEERFTRIKNDRRFPHNAINYCLEEAGISQRDLAAIAFYDNSSLTFERICHALLAVDRDAAAAMWKKIMPSWLRMKLHFPKLIREFLQYDGPVLQGIHHRSHAASCFYPSPFARAGILTIDGVGEWATASIGRGEGNRVQLLKEMRFPHSLGLLYSAFTHFTGFKVNSGEYKMMGMAPYGQPRYVRKILDNIVDLKADGSLELNLKYFSFLREIDMTSEAFDELFDGPRRSPEGRITRREMDIARSIQAVTEEAMLRMARTTHALTGEKNLCMAGGVALNCVANGRLLREGPFEDIWIQPAAGDSGCSLGVALDVWHTYFDKPRKPPEANSPAQGGSYLGPSFSSDEIQGYLETFGYPYRKLSGEERSRFLSERLREGKVVGHFSGRLEFGPRALGARSILGDSRNSQMQAELNLRIKYRESFRPFAPAVLAEHVQEFFELDRESPYMLIVAPVREERRLPFDLASLGPDDDLLPVVRQLRSDVPAITHVDYSARIQTVRRDHHPEFYDLIRQFHRDTGYAVIVNTSFNVRGEPIVCTPQDAYRCFMRTEMDVLALGDYILLKPEQPAWPEGKGEGLENEDIAKTAHEEHPPELMARLDQIFERDFWPAGRRLSAGGVLIDGRFGAAESTWVDAAEPVDMRPSFEIPESINSDRPDPRQFAHDLVRNWHGREAAGALEPTIAKLMKAGLEHQVGVELEEQVSESVYVMF